MDNFNVPKKVNRHVLKALHVLCGETPNNKRGISTSQIIYQVKYQMRNLVPVQNIDSAIVKSLKNMSEVGLVQKLGMQRYNVARRFQKPTESTKAAIASAANNYNNTGNPDRKFFRGKNPQQRSRSSLDPNLKRARSSDDSLSGDEFDRTRKRLHTNTKHIRHYGRKMELPRARQHRASLGPASKNIMAMWHNRKFTNNEAEIDMPLCTPGYFTTTRSPSSETDNCAETDRGGTEGGIPTWPLQMPAGRYKMSSQRTTCGYVSPLYGAASPTHTSQLASQPELDLDSPFTSNLEFMLESVTPAPSSMSPTFIDMTRDTDAAMCCSEAEADDSGDVKRNMSVVVIPSFTMQFPSTQTLSSKRRLYSPPLCPVSPCPSTPQSLLKSEEDEAEENTKEAERSQGKLVKSKTTQSSMTSLAHDECCSSAIEQAKDSLEQISKQLKREEDEEEKKKQEQKSNKRNSAATVTYIN